MSIELRSVSYTYAPGTSLAVDALTDFSLKIEDGEFVGIMGRTGCGKSSLIQLIAGLMTPTKGQVLLNGEDINARGYDRDTLRRMVGVVFQYPEVQLFETTVEKDVAFGLRHLGWPKEMERAAVVEALKMVGFDYEKVRDQSPLGFSGGEKRRLAIAGVLAVRPQVLILDEPVAGLDPLGRAAFLEMIDGLNAGGVTVLMISHNADALAEHAGRIVVLRDGRLFREGRTAEVFADYDDLTANGIGVGHVRHTAELLRRRGGALPPDTVRYEQLISALKRQYGRSRP